MSYSKFNRNFLIVTCVALGMIAGIQGCSSDTQDSPTAGAAGKTTGTAGKGNGTAGKGTGTAGNSGGDAGATNNGGSGNVGGDAGSAGEIGVGGEAGAANPNCDGFLVPCNATCVADFDNKTLTKIKNGVLPDLP